MKYGLMILVYITFVPPVLAHAGHIHDEAILVCSEKQQGDACNYTVGEKKRYIGTCQLFNAVSMCVRNQPIEYLSEHETVHSLQKPITTKNVDE